MTVDNFLKSNIYTGIDTITFTFYLKPESKFKKFIKKYFIEKLNALHQLFCSHKQWRYIGMRHAKFCKGDYIYECSKCKKYDVTHIRKTEAINDCIIDLEQFD